MIFLSVCMCNIYSGPTEFKLYDCFVHLQDHTQYTFNDGGIYSKQTSFFLSFFTDVAVDAEKTRSRIVSQTVFQFIMSLFVCGGVGGGGAGIAPWLEHWTCD